MSTESYKLAGSWPHRPPHAHTPWTQPLAQNVPSTSPSNVTRALRAPGRLPFPPPPPPSVSPLSKPGPGSAGGFPGQSGPSRGRSALSGSEVRPLPRPGPQLPSPPRTFLPGSEAERLAGGGRVPRLTPWVARPRASGKLVPYPAAQRLGREAQDEWPWPQAGAGGEPWPSWAVEAHLAAARSPLKPFVAAGCSFLSPSWSAFTRSPDRKPPVPPPPHRFGEQRSSLGVLWGQCRRGWGLRKPLATELHFHHPSSACLYPKARTFWALVFSSVQWARRCGSDAF